MTNEVAPSTLFPAPHRSCQEAQSFGARTPNLRAAQDKAVPCTKTLPSISKLAHPPATLLAPSPPPPRERPSHLYFEAPFCFPDAIPFVAAKPIAEHALEAVQTAVVAGPHRRAIFRVGVRVHLARVRRRAR